MQEYADKETFIDELVNDYQETLNALYPTTDPFSGFQRNFISHMEQICIQFRWIYAQV